MRVRFLILLLAFAGGLSAQTQVKTLTIDAGKPLFDLPSHLWGLFFEDINFAADGGLYAEMVKNRSFEFLDPLMGWKTEEENSKGSVQIQNRTGRENPRFARLIKPEGNGRFGLINEGFRGMYVKAGSNFNFSLLAKKESSSNPVLFVEIIDRQNRIIGKTTITGLTGEWTKYKSTLSVSATEEKARLRVMVSDPCIIDMDMISLFPAETWKARENGLRPDLVQLLADLKPGFIRFPGGCIVEGRDLSNRYQWKKTVGPVENRHQIINRWNTEFSNRNAPDYFQSFGLGFYEYFQLCEDIGAEPLPILNCGMACQYNTAELVPTDELTPYMDDILDLIEFANGPVTSEWGKLRAEMGHPGPFHLKMLGVGNEQWGTQYVERFRIFSDTLRKVHPEIKLVGGAGPSPDGNEFDELWKEMKRLKADLVDEHYYRSPKWFLDNARRYDTYDRQGPKVFAGEYAAHSRFQTDQPESRNNWEAALAEAAFMTGIERNCDVVDIASYAPLFGHTEGWQWRPDLIWFDNHRSVPTPDYYVQQMFSCNKGTSVLNCEEEGKPLAGQDSLYASATLDKPRGEIIVKLVNSSSVNRKVGIKIEGKTVADKEINTVLLQNDLPAAYNSLDHPDVIKPVEKRLTIDRAKILIPLESRSFTVLRIPVK